MISAAAVELRARLPPPARRSDLPRRPGDRIGLVGRNGAGKTTLTKALAGQTLPAAGTITRSGDVGLPQDPRTGDLDVTARDRILSAQGWTRSCGTCVRPKASMAAETGEAGARHEALRPARRRVHRCRRVCRGVRGRADRRCSGLTERQLDQPLGTLSGGQRRRIELARILFSGAQTLLLDEPTNHLDADSIAWLRDHLKGYKGGLIVISHDVDLLDAVVNKVFHLDANRAELDIYNLGWKAYLGQRETDERRRKRERANVEKKAAVLLAQADKMRAKATKTVAAQNMARRAERMLGGLESERAHDKVAKAALPEPAACGKTPLRASGLSRSYGSREIFTDVDLAIDRGSRVVVLGLNGAGKTTLLRMLAGVDTPTPGRSSRAWAQGRLLRPGAREPRHHAVGAGEHEVGRTGQFRGDGRPQGAGVVPLLR